MLWPCDDEIHFGEAHNLAKDLLDKYEWVICLASDEMLSREARVDLRPLLNEIDDTEVMVVTIRPKMLTFWPDLNHYSVYWSNYLSHGRIFRPKRVRWHNPVHEHQEFDGSFMLWDRYFLHFRQVWGKRCLRQQLKTGDAWPHINDDVRPVSELSVTWQEIVVPFEELVEKGEG